MAHFCRNCGTPLNERAKFCPKCGTAVSTANLPQDKLKQNLTKARQNRPAQQFSNTPKAGRTQYTSNVNQSGPIHQPNGVPQGMPLPKAKKRSGFKPAIAVILVVILLFTSLVKPGFLLPAIEEFHDGVMSELDLGDKVNSDSADGFSDEAGDITVRYSEKELNSAKAETTEISWDYPSANAGNATVQIDYWNLDSENDQLIVKELPEKSEGKQGWAVKAYDIKLASGQKEFSSDITISIPRTGSECPGGCVWYNEETGKWEDVYSELSEDGTNYIIYADHLSLFGEKKYLFDTNIMRLTDNDGNEINVSDGIFVEVPDDKINNPMNWDVAIDYNRMWNMYHKKTMKDIEILSNVLQSATTGKEETTGSKIYGWASDIVSYLGLTDNYNEVLGNAFYDLEDYFSKQTVKQIGKSMNLLDGALTGLKILEEAKKGNATIQEVIKSLPDAFEKNKKEVASYTAGLIIGLKLTGWVGALVSLILYYGVDFCEDCSNSLKLSQLHSDPDLEQIYNYYYTTSVRRIDFDQKSKIKVDEYRKGVISVPSFMEDEEAQILKSAVKRNGLSTKAWGDDKLRLFGWAPAIRTLAELYGDNPEMFGMAIDDLVRSYSWAFWQMTDKDLEQYLGAFLSKSSVISRFKKEIRKATGSQRIKISENLEEEIREALGPVIIDVIQTMQRENCLKIQKEVSSQVLPVLNTRLIFHVKDTTLGNGVPFKKSLYCVDWMKIKQNQKFVEGGNGIRYDDESLITPMRFAGNPEPRFLPLIPRDLKDPTKPSYNNPGMNYPYNADFLPRALKTTDIVYECTFYHYLMMGAPSQMMFTAIENPRYFNPAKSTYGDIKIPKIDGQKSVDIYISVGRADPVWQLKSLVYQSRYYWRKPTKPEGMSGPEEAEWNKKNALFQYERQETLISANADSITVTARAEGNNGMSAKRKNWNEPSVTTRKLPGAVVSHELLQSVLGAPLWAIWTPGEKYTNLKSRINETLPEPQEKGNRTLYINAGDVILIYEETSRNDANPTAWGHIDQNAGEYWEKLTGE